MKALVDSPIHNNETYNRMAQAILWGAARKAVLLGREASQITSEEDF